MGAPGHLSILFNQGLWLTHTEPRCPTPLMSNAQPDLCTHYQRCHEVFALPSEQGFLKRDEIHRKKITVAQLMVLRTPKTKLTD